MLGYNSLICILADIDGAHSGCLRVNSMSIYNHGGSGLAISISSLTLSCKLNLFEELIPFPKKFKNSGNICLKSILS